MSIEEYQLPPITDHDAKPAHRLWVELTTRITTQPLHYRAGDEETAASSVHALFPLVRDLLANHAQAAAFEVMAILMLNRLVRPYTARWHRWMTDEKFAQAVFRRQFRYELQQLQDGLKGYVDLLKILTGPKPDQQKAAALFKSLVPLAFSPDRRADLGGAVEAGIGRQINFKEQGVHPALWGTERRGNFATADEINTAEKEFVKARRQAFGREQEPADKEALLDATGLCLSGGGIRSATFCLGIAQVLQRQGMLEQLDYLSTVSGGGYLGSFLSAYLGTPAPGTTEAQPVPEAAAGTATARGSLPAKWERATHRALDFLLGTTSPTLAATDLTPGKPGDRGPLEKRLYDATAARASLVKAFETRDGRESAAVRHLRNNSRYLLDGGIWGRIKIFGLLVTGILTNILLMLPLPLGGVVAVSALREVHYWDGNHLPGTPQGFTVALAQLLLWVVLALLAAGWFLLPVIRNLARGEVRDSPASRRQTFWETMLLALGLAALAAVWLAAVPFLFGAVTALRGWAGQWKWTQVASISPDTLTTVATGAASLVSGLAAARLKEGWAKQIAALLFSLSGPLLYVLVFLYVGSRVFDAVWSGGAVLAVTAALTLWSWLFVDINLFSPHLYYRNRLCECYLAVRGQDQTGLVRGLFTFALHGQHRGEGTAETAVGAAARLPLSELNATGAAPYHLINTAVNLPSSHEPNLRGRDCDFYVFSRAFCGGPVCGYVHTKTVERLDPHIDLGTAMAISGAAASANMGVATMRQFRFLLSLLNVRLGYWLRNPIAGPRTFWNIPGPRYLFREMTGWIHEKCNYLNLSDGGHIENLALYELLRRRCKFIVVVDGGMEPGMECSDLMLAQRYAEIDLGVRFNLDVADLALNAQRQSRAYAVFGKIRYHTLVDPEGGPRPETAADLGWLLYIKLACVGDEPGYVGDYRRRNPDFPHQSTAKQIYDEAQFEAYRRLGECAAESLFRPEIKRAYEATNPAESPERQDEPAFKSINDWFGALATSLLADNDPALAGSSAPGTGDGGSGPAQTGPPADATPPDGEGLAAPTPPVEPVRQDIPGATGDAGRPG